MDYFEILPEEICDEIFSHFNVRDIKEASLVSKRWYSIIGQSKICMEKLLIRKYVYLDNFGSILSSSRKYQKLYIGVEQSEIQKNTIFLRFIREIVEKFSQSLVSIRISYDLKLKVEDLPKLHMLEFLNPSFKNVIVWNGLIKKAKNLKKLKINCVNLDKKSLQYIKNAILGNENLKILDIGDHNIIQDLSYAKLQLEEFHFIPCLRTNSSIFQAFLSTQASSVQVIGCQFINDNIAYCMSNMPKLHTLIISDKRTLFNPDFIQDVEPEYPTNHTITKLEFQRAFLHSDNFLHAIAIIAKILNLREIKCSYLISEILPHLYNCPLLKIVKYNGLSYEFTQVQKNEIEHHERIKFVKIPYYQNNE